jgi:hypothetical protein
MGELAGWAAVHCDCRLVGHVATTDLVGGGAVGKMAGSLYTALRRSVAGG